MRTIQTTYRYRLEPTPSQASDLRRFAGARRWVWNWALARKRDHYQKTNTTLSVGSLSAELPILKQHSETAWLATVNAQMLQQSLRDLESAFTNFFAKRARFPRFKSKKLDTPRFRIVQGVDIRGDFVKVPNIGLVKARIHRPVIGDTKSATFKQEADGHWYASFVVEQQFPERTERPVKAHIGVDLGLKEFAVLSTGERIANPRYYRTQMRKLARAQRALSRKQRGSRNRDKARQKVAIIHAKVRHQRQDFLHKLSTSLVNNADLVSIEDLSVRGLARTKLAKSVNDAGWGMFRTFLTYKADRADRHLMAIGRFFPSTRLCDVCGVSNTELTLKDRMWICRCGTVHDRDLHAAQNIDREGLRLFNLSVAAGHAET